MSAMSLSATWRLLPVSRSKAKGRSMDREARIDALRRAVVWQPPPPRSSGRICPHTRGADRGPHCRFKVDDVNGLTPKFECELPDGETIGGRYTGPRPFGELPPRVCCGRWALAPTGSPSSSACAAMVVLGSRFRC